MWHKRFWSDLGACAFEHWSILKEMKIGLDIRATFSDCLRMSNTAQQTKSVPLSSLPFPIIVVLSLPGLKSVVRVATPRRVKWYFLLPAVGEGDARAILLEQHNPRTHGVTHWKACESRIIEVEQKRADDKSDPCPFCSKPFKTCGHF